MKPGLYEKLITLGVAEQLKALALKTERDAAGEVAPQVLSRHLFEALIKALRNVPLEERAARQRELANKVVALLGTEVPAAGIDRHDEVADPIELLLALRDPNEARLGTGEVERPKLPLGQSDLLINGPRDLAIGHEIRSELASATAVDIIVSFVKWTGVRVIKPELEDFARRHPGKLRLLTTTYMGATEIEALEALVELGAQVKVSYDARRTRLHAKAWLFHRDTGYSTGIIGSSNLSHAALLDGCEWNVRLSMVDNRTILEKFITTFDQYWSDVAFEPYDRAKFAETAEYRDPARDLLARAVQIRPLPHQSIAFDKLRASARTAICVTSSSQRRAPARQSSPLSTMRDCAKSSVVIPRYCSSRIAKRSSSKASQDTVLRLAMVISESSSSARTNPGAAGTSSHRSKRFTKTVSRRCDPMRTT